MSGLATLFLFVTGNGVSMRAVELLDEVTRRLTVADKPPSSRAGLDQARTLFASFRVPAEEFLLERFRRLPLRGQTRDADFQSLSGEERRLVLELAEATREVAELFPGEEGQQLLELLGYDGLALLRVHGRFVLLGTAWLVSSEVQEHLSDSGLNEQQTVGRWKAVVAEMGDGAGRFWRESIEPQRAAWLDRGELQRYLARPADFHDGRGQPTARALEVGRPGGDPEGAFRRRFATHPWQTILVLALAALLAVLAIPAVRGAVARRLRRSGTRSDAASPLPRHTPLRE